MGNNNHMLQSHHMREIHHLFSIFYLIIKMMEKHHKMTCHYTAFDGNDIAALIYYSLEVPICDLPHHR